MQRKRQLHGWHTGRCESEISPKGVRLLSRYYADQQRASNICDLNIRKLTPALPIYFRSGMLQAMRSN